MKVYNTYPEMLKQADDLCDGGNYDLALQQIITYLQMYPYDPDGRYLLARCLYNQGNIEGAIEAANTSLAYDNFHIFAGNVLALALIDSGDWNEAYLVLDDIVKHYYSTINSIDDDSVRYEFDLSSFLYWQCLESLHYHDEAIIWAKKRVDESSRGDKWRGHLLESLVSAERYVEAENAYGEAPIERKRAIWEIGFTLVSKDNCLLAQHYFLRHLCFCRLPKEILFLKPYIECITCLRKYNEVLHICQYWLSELPFTRYKRIRSFMQMMLAYAYWGMERRQEATDAIIPLGIRVSKDNYREYINTIIDMEFKSLIDSLNNMMHCLKENTGVE